MRKNQFNSPPEELLARSEEAAEIQKKEAGLLFHGTSRLSRNLRDFPFQQNGEPTVDVLRSILEHGIHPHSDNFGKLFLPVQKTISFTRNRIYARAYAEIFGVDEKEETGLQYTYGEGSVWKKLYAGILRSNVGGLNDSKWLLDAFDNFFSERYTWDDRLGLANFKNQRAQYRARRLPTDDNYPLVLGVNENSVNPIELPSFLASRESRTEDVVPASAIKLVESPQYFIDETRDVIKEWGADIEVVPMELAEVGSFMQQHHQ